MVKQLRQMTTEHATGKCHCEPELVELGNAAEMATR